MANKPTFDRSRRYVRKSNGTLFGQGVWKKSDGSLILPGQGIWDAKTKRMLQYNTDGTVTSFTAAEWANRKNNQIVQQRKNLDRKYGVPHLPDKEITISGNNLDRGVTISTNMLDSIYKYSKQTNLPFYEALGLVAQESALGNADGRKLGLEYDSPVGKKYWRYIETGNNQWSPTLLSSGWSYINDNPYRAALNTAGQNTKKLEDGAAYMELQGQKFNVNEPPFHYLFNYYKEGNYNPGDKVRHFQTVRDRGRKLVSTSPEIQEWMKDNNVKPFKSGGRINFYQTGGEINDPFGGNPYQVFNGFTTTPYEEIIELPVSQAVPDNELLLVPSGNIYKVKAGDSLWQIARKHGMSLSKLLKMNPELNIKSIIHPGDEIYTGDYKLLKRSKKSTVKKSTTDIRKVQDRKKPYEAASSQKEYEYRRSTQPEFVAHELADIPYPPVQHLLVDYLQKFMDKAKQYPNPTVAGKTYWINNPYIK